MNVLITGGGSSEPIDNVRSICNFSTGKTASTIADYFCKKGDSVTLLTSKSAILPKNSKIDLIQYKTFSELKLNLENLCKSKNFSKIIHAAAVSDYSPEKIIVNKVEFDAGKFTKIPSDSELIIKMKKNPKLIEEIKNYCNQNCTLIGFKLTSNANEEERISAVKKLFFNEDNSIKKKSPDFVVSNDLSQINEKIHVCKIFSVNKKDNSLFKVIELKTLNELCEFLWSSK